MSAYKKGYAVEYYCIQKLREMGFEVYRSSRSLGLADVIAIDPKAKQVWLVQVKRMEAPKDLGKLKEKFSELKSFDGTYEVKTFLFIKVKGKYEFVKL